MKEITDAPGTDQFAPEHRQTTSRRRLLKVMGVSALTIAAGNIIPDRWSAPLLRFGAVPVHAQTSGEHEDPPAPQGCRYSIAIQAFMPQAEADPVELVSGESDTGMSGEELVYYRAQISPPPPTRSTVSFSYPSGEFGTANTDAGGIAQTIPVRLDDSTGPMGFGTAEVYAEFDCARSATWTFTWGQT